jgi:hypothetical protein
MGKSILRNMSKRLQLIHLAVFAPMNVVTDNSNRVLKGIDVEYVATMKRLVEVINPDRWELGGVCIYHSDLNGQEHEIHDFLKLAPYIIKNLIDIIETWNTESVTQAKKEYGSFEEWYGSTKKEERNG